MQSALALRQQIEAALAGRIPSALTPAPRVLRPVASVGISSVDQLLEGGLPLGAITELVGPESSGRTSLALSFLSRITQAGKVCAWIDVSNALHPESAAAAGVDLCRLLWGRCGMQASANAHPQAAGSFALPEKYLIPRLPLKGLHGGGCGSHPRNEVKGLPEAVSSFFRPEGTHSAEPQLRIQIQPDSPRQAIPQSKSVVRGKPWSRIEQALRVTDLLLQAGGFNAIVLDMGSIAPEYSSRVPLATWFRYRAAAEKGQSCIILLTQHACARSSAGLVLRFEPGTQHSEERTVFTGPVYSIEVQRERFKPASRNIIPLRKPPQRANVASWRTRTGWAGQPGTGAR
jgi:recombination protein RecA